ncbi:MAG: DsrE family protein [Myxococcaceae bacterium]|nr:DsrE family protein [Myxococcaceae bacterium]
MTHRSIFFISSAGYEAAYQAASLGITASAMGDDVTFVFGFDALRALARDSFGSPLTDREKKEITRAEGAGVPTPTKMLSDARSMGARVVACDTMVKLCGLSQDALGQRLDEVMGLSQIWRLTHGARTLAF